MTAKVRRIHGDGWTGSRAQAVIVDPRPFSPMSALVSVQVRMFRHRATGKNSVMKTLTFAKHYCKDSGMIMTETSRRRLSQQLARMIAMNLMCLVVFIAFCALMTFGSLSLLLTFWTEHRAASVIVAMVAIVAIPSVFELTASRLGFWQR
jgi:hypothetical protein